MSATRGAGTAHQADVVGERNREPTLWQIAALFARYANFTFGGGSATSAVVHEEMVRNRRWLNDERFILSFALARVTPGTNVLACCTGLGWMLRKLPGAVVALLASSVPCSLIVVAMTVVLTNLPDNWITKTSIQGAVAAAVAITAKTGWTIAGPHFKAGTRWRVVVIGGTALALHAAFNVSAIYILLLAGVIGAFLPATRA